METNFKTYIGTKTIMAVPMTVTQAKEAGANVPAKYFDATLSCYEPHAKGYLVKYKDDYLSWSPKNVFEESYKIADTYVDRMKIELADLNERICKATKAFYSFGVIKDDTERWQLKEQLDAMQQYANRLYDRISFAVNNNICDERPTERRKEWHSGLK